ncbi:bZIP transcription factor 27-like [Phalaenopsis equestris]|uniref:bZIP transcription factor 27-like n=1 Tax=Phalaenopsis equestris TaxID=78828 RepID=UPI0009E5FA00|nr:bZIP transcription factor 27-like [Phalaenopsis equestris]
MDEVWKDIAFSNLPPNLSSPPLSLRHTAAAAAFHDFLAGDFGDNRRPHSPDPLPAPTLSIPSGNHTNAFLPPARCAISHPSAPAIAGGGGERRWKKMIKNRESAARSRARKKAYTDELEMEVAHLARENAALRREQEKLKMAIDAQATTTKGKLLRASSSTF